MKKRDREEPTHLYQVDAFGQSGTQTLPGVVQVIGLHLHFVRLDLVGHFAQRVDVAQQRLDFRALHLLAKTGAGSTEKRKYRFTFVFFFFFYFCILDFCTGNDVRSSRWTVACAGPAPLWPRAVFPSCLGAFSRKRPRCSATMSTTALQRQQFQLAHHGNCWKQQCKRNKQICF